MQSSSKKAALTAAVAIAGVLAVATAVLAHGGGEARGRGAMCGGGGNRMGPHGGGGGDMRGIHALFANRDEIRRSVTQIAGGVRTTTESDDPAVVAQLREHVQSMYKRLEAGRPIHARDPLFAAIFEHADEIRVDMENTPKGITVTETSANPEVVALIRRHAAVVSLFIENGMHEMMRDH